MAFGLRAYEERRCWANCPCNKFPSFPLYVILIHQRYRQTDGRTDGQTDRQTDDMHRAAKTPRSVFCETVELYKMPCYRKEDRAMPL